MSTRSTMNAFANHLRTNVVGYLALFVALSAGAYAAGLAPDSVRSRHIKDGQVKGADVRDDDLTGLDVAAGTLGGADIAGNSITGSEILESTLGTVPNATIAGHGGFGRQSGGAEMGTSCDPENAQFVICATVNLTTSAQGRALVFGRIRASDEEGSDSGYGDCRLGSSAQNPIPGTTVRLAPSDGNNEFEWVTIVGVTSALNPGSHLFGIDCNQGEAYGAMQYSQARVVAVMISPA